MASFHPLRAGQALLALVGATGCVVETARDASSDGGDAATASAGADAADDGLGTPADEWTWLDVAGSRCGNGAPTGIAVNIRPGAQRLVVFLEGGGACDSGQTCWVQPTADHIASGYGVQQLGSDPVLGLSIFDRDDADNPFADASYVLVPYCTGDLHAGNGIAVYEVNGQPTVTYHYGAHNLDLYLRKLGGSFPAVDHVWLVGQSAGGFGTLFNQSFVASAFGVPTDVIDDSGPGIGISPYPASWSARLPPGCQTCAEGLSPLFLHDRHTSPQRRFAFLSFQVDTVLPSFYGVSQQDVVDWLGQYEQSFAELPNTRSFVAPGAGHDVMDGTTDGRTRAALSTWLEQMVMDDPGWGLGSPLDGRDHAQ
jgi:hypothetical protein